MVAIMTGPAAAFGLLPLRCAVAQRDISNRVVKPTDTICIVEPIVKNPSPETVP
ncbi:MAG TPA: hypothetical protein VHC22_29900 [Pirellulales bacterium]|nr:hypothetical protein [Pirellulales bacterium]